MEFVEPVTLAQRLLPGQVPGRLIVFRTADAVLVLDHFEVYPDGVGFRANLQLRYGRHSMEDFPWERYSWDGATAGIREEMLRLGVVFSDGSSWTNIDAPSPDNEPQPGPSIEFLDGGGGGRSWTVNAWLAPIPPDGPLTFFAEWPAYGVEETEATMDATELRRAADRIEDLWSS